jgi:small subunit ribosomal protein S15
MARLYSKKKGKSGSTKPLKKTNPSWQRYTPKEIELLVVKLAKSGSTPSQIGMQLRDIYGIPDYQIVVGKSITETLTEKKLLGDIPEDLLALIKKYVNLQKHRESNKQDMPAKRGLQLTDSKIRRLVTYCKKVGKLPANWKFDSERFRLIVE